MSTAPAGLFFKNNVIGSVDGLEIIKKLDLLPWTTVSKSEKSRRVQQYGFAYNYSGRSTIGSEIEPMPDFIVFLKVLAEQICSEVGLGLEISFNQCIINNYDPGQKISAHIDNPNFGPVIACFSFGPGLGLFMDFKKNEDQYHHFALNNSLYIMSGSSRYEWSHEIASRKSDIVDGSKIKRERRVSVTFRTVSV